MKYSSVNLEGFGYYLPPDMMTSREVEQKIEALYQKLDYKPGRLEQISGIRERRLMPPGAMPSSVAIEAGKRLFEKTEKDDIGAVFYCGVCRDYLEPATAAVVHHNLGLDPNCLLFDISNACVGFLNAIVTAANMIELGQIDSALIVTGENPGPIYKDTIDLLNRSENISEEAYRKYIACFTLGAGGVALKLTHKLKSQTNHRLSCGIYQAATHGYKYCMGTGDSKHQTMLTDTRNLMEHGLILSKVAWELFERESGWDRETVDKIITHQVSQQHQVKLYETLEFDIKKDFSTYPFLANTGSVAAPITFQMAVEDGHIKEGDKVAWIGFGSGINTIMLGVDW